MDLLKTVTKTSVDTKLTDVNAIHSFTADEVNAYCHHINYFLAVFLSILSLITHWQFSSLFYYIVTHLFTLG